MTELKNILKIITDYSAYQFAQDYLNKQCEKENEDSGFMLTMYGCNNESFTVLSNRCFCSGLKRYEDLVNIYRGFIENGEVFVLDRKEGIVYFLSRNDGQTIRLIPHYNPKNIDVIELSVGNNWVQDKIENGIYEISKNDNDLIDELFLSMNDK